MQPFLPPFNFKKWIDENRASLKPPVGNRLVYEDTEFMIMVVGGPNARKDFHVNRSEEFFYQIEGDINVRSIVNGEIVDIPIKEGDIFLLPSDVPHSPKDQQTPWASSWSVNVGRGNWTGFNGIASIAAPNSMRSSSSCKISSRNYHRYLSDFIQTPLCVPARSAGPGRRNADSL